MLTIGQEAPAFEANSTQGNIRLADYLGKQPIVLIFYPKDETPICTKQLCAVRDSKSQYAQYNTVVLGVNPGSIEEHRQFAQKNRYDFPLVTDIVERIREQYDVGKIFILGQQRVVYVIDQNGRIAYAKKGNRPTKEIIEALAKQHA